MEVKVVAGSAMAIGNFPGTPYIWQDMAQRPEGKQGWWIDLKACSQSPTSRLCHLGCRDLPQTVPPAGSQAFRPRSLWAPLQLGGGTLVFVPHLY